MSKIRLSLFFSMAFLVCSGVSVAQEKSDRKKKNKKELATTKTDSVKEKKVPKLSIADKVKSCKKTEGLFTIYQDTVTGSIQLYIKKNQLNKEFIYQSYSMNGPTTLGLNQSMHRATNVFNIKKANDKIEFGLVNTNFYYDKNNAVSKTAGTDIAEAIFLAEKVVAKDSTGFLIAADGLFISEKIFGGVSMGVSEINFIELPGVEITTDYMIITADFTEDLENPKITTSIDFGGYTAMNFQPIKDFTSAEQYQTILKSIAENYTINTEYSSLKTENDGVENIGKKPFVMKLTFDGKDLIQNAGGNYLFSVGKLIGSQMELYQENKRTLPVEIDHPHAYQRTLKIILPKGVTAKNLEKFNMNFKTDLNNKTEAGFVSSYTEKDGVITVTNTEFYNVVNYPLEKFNEYKDVINAAADFNKIVIMLSKS